MKADYDSEADALSIDLIKVDHWDDGKSVDDNEHCNVAFRRDGWQTLSCSTPPNSH
jgi:hypothetical protein